MNEMVETNRPALRQSKNISIVNTSFGASLLGTHPFWMEKKAILVWVGSAASASMSGEPRLVAWETPNRSVDWQSRLCCDESQPICRCLQQIFDQWDDGGVRISVLGTNRQQMASHRINFAFNFFIHSLIISFVPSSTFWFLVQFFFILFENENILTLNISIYFFLVFIIISFFYLSFFFFLFFMPIYLSFLFHCLSKKKYVLFFLLW